MAHFIVATIGTYGDVYPFAQVAIALKKMGHQTTFITNPYFEQTVKQFGLDFYPLGTKEQYLMVLQNDKLWNDQTFLDIALTLFVPNLDNIDTFISQHPQDEKFIILAHQNLLANAGLAHANRPNTVTVIGGALYPSVFGEESDPRHVENPQERQYSDLPLIIPVNRARARLGLPLVRTYSDLFTCLASFNALLFSQWFGEKEAHWPNNTIPGEFIFQEVIGSSGFTNELEEFLASPDKPILCTFGTGNLHCQEYFEHALNAIQRANRRAIFICKDRNNLPKDLPESVLWLEYCNDFPALLQRCSLIVHHGGIGTLAESARAGIPQLITPSLGDQWDNAARIKNLQLGSNIPAPALNSENFYQAITEILQSAAINKNCADLGKQIKNRLSPRDIANNIVQTLIHAKVLES